MQKHQTLFQWKRDILPALLVIQSAISLKWVAGCALLGLSYFALDFLNAKDIKHSTDFAAYYAAAVIYLQKLGSIYDVDQYKAIQEAIFHQIVSFKKTYLEAPLPFLNPPQAILLFLPFGLMSFPMAYALWMVINATLSVVLAKLYASYFKIQTRLEIGLAFLLIIGNTFWYQAVAQGQLTLVLATALMMLLHAIRSNKPWLAAICLIVLAMKPHFFFLLVLPVFFSLPKRFFYFAFIVGIATGGLCMLLLSPDILQHYVAAIQKVNFVDKGYGADFSGMQNLRKALYYYFGFSLDSSLYISVSVLAATSVILTGIWAYYRPKADSAFFSVLLALTVSINIFLSPWLHVHDLLLMLTPAAILLQFLPLASKKAKLYVAILYILFITFYLGPCWIIFQMMIIVGLIWLTSCHVPFSKGVSQN